MGKLLVVGQMAIEMPKRDADDGATGNRQKRPANELESESLTIAK